MLVGVSQEMDLTSMAQTGAPGALRPLAEDARPPSSECPEASARASTHPHPQ